MPENYVLLERTELNASAASVTFANIPQSGYTDLKIVTSGRTDAATDFVSIALSFNGSSASFTNKLLQGDGSGTVSASLTNYGGATGGTSTTASTFSNVEMYIPNYTSANNKSFSVDSVVENNATATRTSLAAGLWSNTAAITSITLTSGSGNFVANSTFSLYGIAAVGTTPAIAPKAYGGNRIDNDGTYWYHTFTSSGAFVPQTGITADILQVAGAGGGAFRGNRGGGGGGAGGLLAFTSQALTAISYNVTVGGGGAGGSGTFNGVNGSNSQFASLTASVGGGGGDGDFGTGGSGGSGGGASITGTGGARISGQGFVGGNGGSSSPLNFFGAGGGGGATAAGAVGVTSGSVGSSNGGAGGAGSNAYSTWATATSTGASGFYAGGGGGGTGDYNGGNGGAGGAGGSGGGGAGTGVLNAAATAGTANTGGGGGGSNFGAGGAGGSGIIIVRYPIA